MRKPGCFRPTAPPPSPPPPLPDYLRKTPPASPLLPFRLSGLRWLDDSKEGLFSPATSANIVRLIPALWLTWKQTRPSEQYVIVALDVKDNYLEVPQSAPVVSRVQGKDLMFLRMVPGQHEGSQQWFAHFCDFLGVSQENPPPDPPPPTQERNTDATDAKGTSSAGRPVKTDTNGMSVLRVYADF